MGANSNWDWGGGERRKEGRETLFSNPGPVITTEGCQVLLALHLGPCTTEKRMALP